MASFIVEYWLQFMFGLIAVMISAWCGRLSTSVKSHKSEQDALKTAMVAVLHDRLVQACTHYLESGYIPVKDSEDILDNIRLIYEAYHTLGGNGTGTALYERFLQLPIR